MTLSIRQFESLVRLTRARARCEFSPICTEKHAADVLEIMRENGTDINRRAIDNDFESPSNSIGCNKRVKSSKNSKESRELLMKNLTRLVNLKGDCLLATNELKDAYKNQFGSTDDALFVRILNDLNESGYIIKKGLDLYQILRI
uniref:MCM AAA-lid domain-containing protein n=1 Tax=Romanomermis culicivorax TaxID=13658 RepID=A0A915KT38_ROMCU